MHWIALTAQPDAAAQTLQDGVADAATALGWWALQFTPRVALVEGAVLLEVSASERLWGGRAALLRRLLGPDKPVAKVRHAQGATSLLALGRLLAGQPEGTRADDLPLPVLAAARPHLPTLARLGCTRWGDLRALPRDGLARRFGAGLLDALDRAYGERPEVYPWLAAPEAFDAALELGTPVDSAPALLFAARRLLAQLQLWLTLRQRAVLAIELSWTLDARRGACGSGSLVLRSAEPAHDMAHLQRLLAEHLAQLSLPAPAQSLRLRSLETVARLGRSVSLLPDDRAPADAWVQLVERLSARLGADRVLHLQPCADHRPERKQVWRPATETLAGSAWLRQGVPLHADWASALYPTWLLLEPLRLTVCEHSPQYGGPLTLLAGPQRLETGWWSESAGVQGAADGLSDAGPVMRDYFVARAAAWGLLWVYRERRGGAQASEPERWYLHGLFA